VTIRSCLADSALYPTIAEHKCNKVVLCPSALWADMAMVVGSYIWSQLHPGTEIPGLNVSDMLVPKAFIPQIPQRGMGEWVEMNAEASITAAEGGGVGMELGTVRCSFRSIHPDGAKIEDKATCTLRYESKAYWTAQWTRLTHLINNSISILRSKAKAKTGEANRMERGLAYKTFESFVTYSPKYQGMNEVIFSGFEGTSRFTFQTTGSDYRPPYHLDNTCHLSGFLCNAAEGEEEDVVYVSEGWDAARILHTEIIQGSMVEGKELVSYVLMQPSPTDRHLVQGDVYTLMDGEIVVVWEGMKFKRLPRRVVNIFLPRPKVTGPAAGNEVKIGGFA
jgi:iterative type I PKS product template protein